MPINNTARNAYLGASIQTASPARLLVMLCDRLVLDLQRGRDAQVAGDREQANTQLLHAQDIVMELRSSLDTKVWKGGEQLGAIYDWMFSQLVKANTRMDVATTEHVLKLATEIADAWRQAALLQARA